MNKIMNNPKMEVKRNEQVLQMNITDENKLWAGGIWTICINEKM